MHAAARNAALAMGLLCGVTPVGREKGRRRAQRVAVEGESRTRGACGSANDGEGVVYS